MLLLPFNKIQIHSLLPEEEIQKRLENILGYDMIDYKDNQFFRKYHEKYEGSCDGQEFIMKLVSNSLFAPTSRGSYRKEKGKVRVELRIRAKWGDFIFMLLWWSITGFVMFYLFWMALSTGEFKGGYFLLIPFFLVGYLTPMIRYHRTSKELQKSLRKIVEAH